MSCQGEGSGCMQAMGSNNLSTNDRDENNEEPLVSKDVPLVVQRGEHSLIYKYYYSTPDSCKWVENAGDHSESSACDGSESHMHT